MMSQEKNDYTVKEMMGEIDQFRAYVLNKHLSVESLLNNFISSFVVGIASENLITKFPAFDDLILDNLSFRKKQEIVRNIIKDTDYRKKLDKLTNNRILNKPKEEQKIIRGVNGKKYKINKLMRYISKLNKLRNKLAHTHTLFDKDTLITPMMKTLDEEHDERYEKIIRNLSSDKQYLDRGKERKNLNKYFIFIEDFFINGIDFKSKKILVI